MTNGNHLYFQKIIYHSRLINLLIVGITQAIIVFLLFNLQPDQVENLQTFLLFIGCTVSITLGGYFINDYFDYEIDSINKEKAHRLSKVDLLIAYFLTSMIGFSIAIWICSINLAYEYLIIYPLAIGCLFLYASHFKSQGLIGNFVVSLFSSLVILLLWFVYNKVSNPLNVRQEGVLLFFASFIFLSSMAREIIKDCQDLKGDKKFGLRTLPISIGLVKTNFFIGFFLLILLLVELSWLVWMWSTEGLLPKLTMLPIIGLTLFLIYKIPQAKTTDNYSYLSKLMKALMGLGIISLLIISVQS